MNVAKLIQRASFRLTCAAAFAAIPFFAASSVRADAAAEAPTTNSPTTAPATQPSIVPNQFIRFVDDGKGGGSLQTAEVTFVNPAGVHVHLIAAIHIAEKSYYQSLNQEFTGFDALLYELVKPKDMAPPRPGDAPSNSGVSQFQRLLKNVLDLDFQLDDIDYSPPNFVNADLDKDTFEKMQAERGESFESLMVKQILAALQHPNLAVSPDDIPDPITLLTSPDGQRRVKLIIARQLGDMDASAMNMGIPDGSVILTERNKAAMAVLSDTLASGKKNIGIFYGAAHLPDQTARIEAMGFTPVAIQWHMAWDLTLRGDQPSLLDKMVQSMFKDVGNAVAPAPDNGN